MFAPLSDFSDTAAFTNEESNEKENNEMIFPIAKLLRKKKAMKRETTSSSKQKASPDYSFRTQGRVILHIEAYDGQSPIELTVYLYQTSYMIDWGTFGQSMAPGYGRVEYLPVTYAEDHTYEDFKQQYAFLEEVFPNVETSVLWEAMFGHRHSDAE